MSDYRGLLEEMETNKEQRVTLVTPSYLSPEWHDYVMTQFVPEELSDGMPTTAGLRRVVQLLLGPIISSEPKQVWPVEGNLAGRATVLYEIKISWQLEVPEGKYGGVRTYSDVADAFLGNVDATFASFAPATASTRAEGRALKKALGLRILAAEEVTNTDTAKAAVEGVPDAIGDVQVTFIDQRCKKLDINLVSFINYEPLTGAVGNNFRGIYDVSKAQAGHFVQELNVLTNEKSKIPDVIKGYVEWKEKPKKGAK